MTVLYTTQNDLYSVVQLDKPIHITTASIDDAAQVLNYGIFNNEVGVLESYSVFQSIAYDMADRLAAALERTLTPEVEDMEVEESDPVTVQ